MEKHVFNVCHARKNPMLREIAQDSAKNWLPGAILLGKRCTYRLHTFVAWEARGRVQQRVATQHHALMKQQSVSDLRSDSSPSLILACDTLRVCAYGSSKAQARMSLLNSMCASKVASLQVRSICALPLG